MILFYQIPNDDFIKEISKMNKRVHALLLDCKVNIYECSLFHYELEIICQSWYHLETLKKSEIPITRAMEETMHDGLGDCTIKLKVNTL